MGQGRNNVGSVYQRLDEAGGDKGSGLVYEMDARLVA